MHDEIFLIKKKLKPYFNKDIRQIMWFSEEGRIIIRKDRINGIFQQFGSWKKKS